jgi:hypothetical protein
MGIKINSFIEEPQNSAIKIESITIKFKWCGEETKAIGINPLVGFQKKTKNYHTKCLTPENISKCLGKIASIELLNLWKNSKIECKHH